MNNETLATLAAKKLDMSMGALKDFRETHLGLFKKRGLESPHAETYKFTNLSKFMEKLEYSSHKPRVPDAHSYEDQDFIDLIFVDGELKSEVKVKGLKIHSLAQDFGQIAEELKNDNALSHLHHSLLDHGVVIEVEKKTKLPKPLRLLNVITHSGVEATTFFIKLRPFAEVCLVEDTQDLGVAYALTSETYISVEESARLEHIQLGRGSHQSFYHGLTQSKIARDGIYRNILFNVSGMLNRRNLNMELLEQGAHGESYNLFLTNHQEHSDIFTTIQHLAADTTSNQIAKGILDGESKGIFTGKIHIHPKAQRVSSGQINKNLLLSKKAQVHSQPQLEIFADDVKCSHGSTTGQLSDDEVFYFEARGIPAEKARTLLAHGFGLEVVLKIENQVVRRKVEELVLQNLKEKFSLGGKA